MSGFSTYQEVRDALSDGRVLTGAFNGVGPAAAATPAWQSGWYTQSLPDIGGDPAAGSGTPGAGGTAYASTSGGIVFPDTGTAWKYVVEFTARHAATGTPLALKLTDRLVGVGSIAVNSTGVKNVNSVALTRYTSGVGVEAYCEIQTAGTTTIPVVHLSSYTNSDGTGGHSGGNFTFHSATAIKGALQGPLPLQAGDVGIQSVETLTVDTAGGGSGVINLILVQTLMWGGSPTPASNEPPFQRLSPLPFAGLARVYDGATLQWMRKGGSSGTRVEGIVRVVMAP